MEHITKENGKIIKCMEKVSLNGWMVGLMKENTRMTKKMDMVYLFGLKERNMKESG